MQDREILTADQKRDESFMLQMRLREGLAISELNPAQIKALTDFPKEIEQIGDRLVLTSSGRLIADRIVRTLIMA